MTRQKLPDSARVPVGLKITEAQAAGIDAAIACVSQRQGMTRPQWIRAMLDAQLKSLATQGHIEYGQEDSAFSVLQPNPLRGQPHTEVTPWPVPDYFPLLSSREEETPGEATRTGRPHDHSHEAWDTESGMFPCGCSAEDLPQ